MYYQADLSHSRRIFKLLLLLSFTLHLGVCFFKKTNQFKSLLTPQAFTNKISVKIVTKTEKPILKNKASRIIKKKTVKKLTRKQTSPSKVKDYKNVAKRTASVPKKKPFKSFIRNFVQPTYPRLAKRRGITGRVDLTLMVLGNGKLEKVIVSSSSGSQLLDKSAIEAAKRWTFKSLSTNPKDLFQLSKAIVYRIN